MKSWWKPEAVKPGTEGSGKLLWIGLPDELKKLSQSKGWVTPPMVVVVDALTSPSSWNASSWTARAGPAPSAMTVAVELTTASPAISQRRLRCLPVPCVSDTLIFPLLGRVLMLGDP